jgi:hypothetical protein
VSAEQYAGRLGTIELVTRQIADVERVRGRTSRMLGRMVQGREVVVLEFDFGTLGNLVSQAHEDVGDLGGDPIDEMSSSQWVLATGKRHVDHIRRDSRLHVCGRQLGLAGLQRRLKGLADFIGGLAHGGTLFRRQSAQSPEHTGERALLTEIGDAHAIQLRQIGCGHDGSEPLGLLFFQLFDDTHVSAVLSS